MNFEDLILLTVGAVVLSILLTGVICRVMGIL